MSYKVTTHRLRCDVRPVISDGDRDIVSGYSDPIPCRCSPNPAVIPGSNAPAMAAAAASAASATATA